VERIIDDDDSSVNEQMMNGRPEQNGVGSEVTNGKRAGISEATTAML
jgi:hypothetical protein